MVYKIAYSMTKTRSDAEDIYQEVFIKLFENKKEFENDEHEKAWLIRVTVNCCKMLYRKAMFRKETALDENIDIGYLPNEEDEVYSYVKQLPRKYSIVIYLFYYEEYKINEIAKILKTTEGTIKSQLSRARNLLKDKMKGDFEDEQ